MEIPYERVVTSIRPGDVIAFGGDDLKSRAIQLTTRSAVSHVAVVVRSYEDCHKESHGLPHLLVEATWLTGERPGVNAHWLRKRLTSYRGAMWWLPLSANVRREFDTVKFQGYLLSRLGVSFDFYQCLQSALDLTDNTPLLRNFTYAKEDLERVFCSELVAAGLRAGGVLRQVNCSEVTPADISRFALYDSKYVQLKGKPQHISGYNSLEPERWTYRGEPTLAYGLRTKR